MTYLKALLGALIGSAIGGAIWVAIGYFTGYEVGYVAWGLGGLAGIGVAVMVPERERNIQTSFAAVAVAVCGILASKYLVASLLVDRELGPQLAMMGSGDSHLVTLADEVVEEWESNGKKVNWPAGMSLEEAGKEADYPPEIWKEARQRFDALPPEQQTAFQEGQKAANAMMADAWMQAAKEETFKNSFSPFDLLFFALAAMTAFRIGGSPKEG